MRVVATAPQFTARKGLSRRRLNRWMVSAASSLPVPLSPASSTLACVGATRGFADFEALALDEDAEAVAESRIVVDDHGRETGRDPARRPHSPGLGLHVPSPFLGSVKQNRAPFDPSLSPQMRPPWRRTILAAIASPRPVPSY